MFITSKCAQLWELPLYVCFQNLHVELHQYKKQLEGFQQLTQHLIAAYQQDDTSRLKRATEQVNQRYNHLKTR